MQCPVWLPGTSFNQGSHSLPFSKLLLQQFSVQPKPKPFESSMLLLCFANGHKFTPDNQGNRSEQTTGARCTTHPSLLISTTCQYKPSGIGILKQGATYKRRRMPSSLGARGTSYGRIMPSTPVPTKKSCMLGSGDNGLLLLPGDRKSSPPWPLP